jgi:hypothetical protein
MKGSVVGGMDDGSGNVERFGLEAGLLERKWAALAFPHRSSKQFVCLKLKLIFDLRQNDLFPL